MLVPKTDLEKILNDKGIKMVVIVAPLRPRSALPASGRVPGVTVIIPIECIFGENTYFEQIPLIRAQLALEIAQHTLPGNSRTHRLGERFATSRTLHIRKAKMTRCQVLRGLKGGP